jgi:hypothetical protein
VSKLTPTEALAAADIAREAARLVARPGGWWQGPEGSCEDGSRVCALLAIDAAARGDEQLLNIVWDAARCRTDGMLIGWNDAPERKQSDVVELFESIAKHFDREASRIGDGD